LEALLYERLVLRADGPCDGTHQQPIRARVALCPVMSDQTVLHSVPIPVPQPHPATPPPQRLDLAQRLGGKILVEEACGRLPDDLVRRMAQQLAGALVHPVTMPC